MLRDKAHDMVDSIFSTHQDALRGSDDQPVDAQGVLDAARTDIHGLVDEIISDCTSENERE